MERSMLFHVAILHDLSDEPVLFGSIDVDWQLAVLTLDLSTVLLHVVLLQLDYG
jgi:hypothetical protein